MSDVIVSWRDYGCFSEGPLSEETYQNERSAAKALLAKEWNRARAYYVNGKPVTRAQVEHSVKFYEQRDRERDELAAARTAKRVKLAADRRMAVVEVLTCQSQGIWLDRVNRVPNIEWARELLARDDMRGLLATMQENADQLIAAYEGVKVQ